MHEYSTEPSRRSRIHMLIAVVAGFAAIVANILVVPLVSVESPFASLIMSMFGPTSMALFWWLTYYTFDRGLWKFPFVGNSTASHLPNLNGTWHGAITPITRGKHPPRAAAITVRQTWSQMAVQFHILRNGRLWTSPSRMAMLSSTERAEGGLNYEFVSRSHHRDEEEPQGCAMIRYDCGKLEGEYYAMGTGEEECRVGNIEYTFIGRRRLSHEELTRMLLEHQQKLDAKHVKPSIAQTLIALRRNSAKHRIRSIESELTQIKRQLDERPQNFVR